MSIKVDCDKTFARGRNRFGACSIMLDESMSIIIGNREQIHRAKVGLGAKFGFWVL